MTLLTQLTTVNTVVFLPTVQSAVKVVLMFIAPLNSFRFLEMNLLNALVTSLFTGVIIPVLKQAPYGQFYITGSKIINSQRSKTLKCGLKCGCTVEFCAWKGSYLFFFAPLKVCDVIVWHMVD